MAIKTKAWTTGTGSATIQYDGQGDGTIIITSDANSLYEARSMQISVGATDGIEIIHKGNDVWVDALGRVVS